MNDFDTTATPAPAAPPGDDFQLRFQPGAPSRPPRVRLITSEQLFAEFPEVQIAHGDAVYRLRQTSLGKLILTK
jgi:hemin uptake protein HemP